MMKATKWFALILGLASLTACTGRFPNAQRTLFSVDGYGVSLALLQSSASAPETGAGSEAIVGKWASQAKRGSSFGLGTLQAPGPAAVDWTLTSTLAGRVESTRLAALANGATGFNYRVIDSVTGAATIYAAQQTGLVSGRTYKGQAAWFNGALQVSDWSAGTNIVVL